MVKTRKRVIVGSFEFEGNDFSNKVSGADVFRLYAEGAAVLSAVAGLPLAIAGGIELLSEADADFEVIPTVVAQGGSGGTVETSFYNNTVKALLDRIAEAGPVDGVFLALHGAMVSPGVPDAEGNILKAVRTIVGEKALIAASLDLHAHVTPAMVAAANILVGYTNYPHDDAHTTGQRTAALLRDALQDKTRPVMRMARRSMIVPVPGSSTLEPGAPLFEVKALAREMEKRQALSTSYFTAQPWLDGDDVAFVALAITDGDSDRASAYANEICDLAWSLREKFVLPISSMEAALAAAAKTAVRPVILADAADSVGAGASGDASYVLNALVHQGPMFTAALSLVDPVVAAEAHRAGVGAVLDTTIGFRLDGRSGSPLPFVAEVVSLHDGLFTYESGPAGGVQADMGMTAVLRIGKVVAVVTSKGTYEYGAEQFSSVGIDVYQFDIVVLKNGMNFRNLLRPGMTWHLINGVGTSSADLAALPWRRRPSPFWPRDTEASVGAQVSRLEKSLN